MVLDEWAKNFACSIEINKMLQIILPQDVYEAHLKAINDIAFTRREIDMIACI